MSVTYIHNEEVTMKVLWSAALSCSLVSSVMFAKARPSSSGWGTPHVMGEIDSALLPEASGLAQSRSNPSHLFHVNDAGSTPSFVVTDRDGSHPHKVDLKVDAVTDTEDLAVGDCPDEGSCLYIADIGDNKFHRPFVRIHAVRDISNFGPSVAPAFSATLRYDDGQAHNAESLAIHPAGYAYILTKETPAQLYRFALSSLEKSDDITMEKVGELSLSTWLAGTDKPKKIIPTSMDIRPDGKQWVILTRSAGISIDLDLAEALGPEVQDINRIIDQNGVIVERLPMIKLPQSEAVTYVDQGAAILYSSEIVETGGSSAPLVEVRLQK
jgi:hypothetical protein